VSKAVGTLLRSTSPLPQTALADAADVLTRSLRRHLDALVALHVVRETGEG
jgi:predicted ArsR family transcriptional regulator